MSVIFALRRLVTFTGIMVSTGMALALFTPSCFSQPLSHKADSELASHRFYYQKAKAALEKKNMKEYRQHLSKLGDYPLRQYLEFSELRSRFNEYPDERVDQFLVEQSDSYLATRIRVHYLQHLAAREKWSSFLKYYEPSVVRSLELKCHALHARLKSGDKTALQEVDDIWNVGKSQPDACDPVFTLWRKEGQLTQELAWSRFHKAMEQGNTSFARYLSNLLTTNKAHAELYFQVDKNPKLIAQRKRFQQQDLPTQHIIAHGIKKLARQSPSEALKHWQMYEAQQLFPEDIMLDTKLTIVKRLIRSSSIVEAQELLSYSHSLRQEDIMEDMLREILASGDWELLEKSMVLLDDKNRQSERWRYWAARTQETLQRPIDGFPSAETLYREIAQNRSFYGFLSADKIQQQYSLVDQSSELDPSLIREIADKAGMQRAYELWLTGNTHEARAEWLYESRKMDEKQLAAAGQLAQEWGWYNTGIQTMINGNLWNELTVRFPLAYREEITKVAQDAQLEPTFVYAIARQESAFDVEARSPVGAMGLMQIMPQTAQYTAQKSGIKHSSPKELLQPDHNMKLGSAYLNYLMKTFNGNRILAAAAYNAGPHRVNRWLSSEGKQKPVDVWIETIPFRETRNYVQNVLCFSVIYGYRLGQPTVFLSELEANQYL